MSYVVTFNRPGHLPEAEPDAVENIYEAREAAMAILRREMEDCPEPVLAEYEQALDFAANMERPAVIGPLPTGYVIDVARAYRRPEGSAVTPERFRDEYERGPMLYGSDRAFEGPPSADEL